MIFTIKIFLCNVCVTQLEQTVIDLTARWNLNFISKMHRTNKTKTC